MQTETVFARAQRFDMQALASLHDTYYPVVYRYVAYRLDDQQVCEDIAADVFLRLIEALKDNRRKIEDVRAWLLGTAAHLITDYLRRKYRRPTEALQEHYSAGDDHTPEHSAERSDHHRRVQKAMLRLTLDQQNVLALRFSQDLSLEEAARVMGKSVGAVKVLQFRALESLRRILEER